MHNKVGNLKKVRNPSYASALKRCQERAGALRIPVGVRGLLKVVRPFAAISRSIASMSLTDIVMVTVALLHASGTLFLWWLGLTIFWR